MVLERKRDGNFENRKSDDSSDVWCEAIRSKKQREVDGHVGYRGVFLDRIYVYNNANNELEKINNWLIANRLLLNTKKNETYNILNSL